MTKRPITLRKNYPKVTPKRRRRQIGDAWNYWFEKYYPGVLATVTHAEATLGVVYK